MERIGLEKFCAHDDFIVFKSRKSIDKFHFFSIVFTVFYLSSFDCNVQNSVPGILY